MLSLLLLSIAGCGNPYAPDHWGAVPRRTDLEVPAPRAVPSSHGTEYRVAQEARAALWPALDQVDSLTEDRQPEPTREGLEWRSTPGLSDAVAWRFVLRNVHDAWSDPGHIGGAVKPAQLWQFALSVKPKMEPDSAFRVVLDGERATPDGDWSAQLGTGTVRVDWRAACAAVDRVTCRGFPRLPGGGLASVEARLVLEHGRRLLDVEVHEVAPLETGERHTYYTASGEETSDGAGTVQASARNEFPGEPVPPPPSVSRSAWLASGAGARHTVSDWGPDSNGLLGVQRGEVCWGSTGTVVYQFDAMGGPYPTTETGSRAACALEVEALP